MDGLRTGLLAMLALGAMAIAGGVWMLVHLLRGWLQHLKRQELLRQYRTQQGREEREEERRSTRIQTRRDRT